MMGQIIYFQNTGFGHWFSKYRPSGNPTPETWGPMQLHCLHQLKPALVSMVQGFLTFFLQ